jgi:twitching motility two-component system response regulator PilG
MPGLELPSPVVEAAPATFVEIRHDGPSVAEEIVHAAPEVEIEVTAFSCPFCGEATNPQAISCSNCFAVLTLSDLELLLGNHNADKTILRRAVEEMERQGLSNELSADELVILGLGHLNLRNFQLGHSCLSDASRLAPNNVVLAGQVNALLIRLDEIRQQEEVHLRMPKGKSILVVDDSPTVRKLISGKLEKSGHTVICANDGVEAMERLEHLVPDLVLLDINMPRMDGYQVCKLIRSNEATKDVTVVMISGKDGFFDKVRGRMAGTTGYITKPFGPETLMKAVEMYLSGEVPEPEDV